MRGQNSRGMGGGAGLVQQGAGCGSDHTQTPHPIRGAGETMPRLVDSGSNPRNLLRLPVPPRKLRGVSFLSHFSSPSWPRAVPKAPAPFPQSPTRGDFGTFRCAVSPGSGLLLLPQVARASKGLHLDEGWP